jgi:hypothetical protein
MCPFSPREILDIWEGGQAKRYPVDRAIGMLSAAHPEMECEVLAELDIARRDALILDLREEIFGDTMQGFYECPECSMGLEILLNTAEIRALRGPEPEADGLFELSEGGIKIRFRLPNSTDLSSAIRHNLADDRALIVKRCIKEVKDGRKRLSVESLTSELLAVIADRMAECAPLADIVMELHCPACGHRFEAPFDLSSFFWTELSSRAKRFMHEVHTLARAYGWRESDILGMSAARRLFYLEMADQ